MYLGRKNYYLLNIIASRAALICTWGEKLLFAQYIASRAVSYVLGGEKLYLLNI